MNLKSLTLPLLLTLTSTNALVLPNPPYALSSKSNLPSSPPTNHAIDTNINTASTSTSTSTSDPTSSSTNNPSVKTTVPIPIPIDHPEYDLDRMSLPILKSTLQTCDVVFAVVALVLLVPGLVVVLVRGWNYLRSSPEGDVEGEALLGGGGVKGKGGSVMNQMENGEAQGGVKNGRIGDRKVMVEEEGEEVVV
ncbi:uncharacterized protein BDW47DRAFT_128645 [Aspergillus candidus]|uniref:Mid2 domain-containing protein n=1 Tax=Aspergillus candidus TaxID=41067 RepID=A0A2I2F2J2_ASPCN|nr:hypothetical protein BDW47DRAFT_128645 [Aspergillus candidus]PLB34837.1 hypothetical protein BDW47DRAFT_128645 [Aspergillus candidus]